MCGKTIVLLFLMEDRCSKCFLGRIKQKDHLLTKGFLKCILDELLSYEEVFHYGRKHPNSTMAYHSTNINNSML